MTCSWGSKKAADTVLKSCIAITSCGISSMSCFTQCGLETGVCIRFNPGLGRINEKRIVPLGTNLLLCTYRCGFFFYSEESHQGLLWLWRLLSTAAKTGNHLIKRSLPPQKKSQLSPKMGWILPLPSLCPVKSHDQNGSTEKWLMRFEICKCPGWAPLWFESVHLDIIIHIQGARPPFQLDC